MTILAPESPVFVEISDVGVIGQVVHDENSVFVEVITVTQPTRVELVQPVLYAEVIDGLVRGPTGPPGPTGLIKVNHGDDPNVPRPDAPLVYWVGSVKPVHADPDDLLMLKEA